MDITSLEQQAIDFARRGDFGAQAKETNEELTRLAPTNQGAWTRLARCNIELGLFDDANAALERALEINPQNTIARSLLQEAIRRQLRSVAPEPVARPARASRARKSAAPSDTPARGGFSRPQFAALDQLTSAAAVEALTPPIESLLMALNERPFAAKVVEARNRAARSGSRLFRRNSIYAGSPGHVYAFHHGGRWEPQINLGFFAASHWGRSGMRAGIGFNTSADGRDPDRESGREQAMEYYERFQRLVSGEWRQLLTAWMSAGAGFIQYGDKPAVTDMRPAEAVDWLASNRHAAEQGWVFVGRWLFQDRADDAAVMEQPGTLTKWAEQTFVELLPLWMSVYR